MKRKIKYHGKKKHLPEEYPKVLKKNLSKRSKQVIQDSQKKKKFQIQRQLVKSLLKVC